MNRFARVMQDSATMFRRQMVHMKRYPMVMFLAGIPVILLLLFVYVFGGTMGAGLSGPGGGRADYLAYVLPGVLLITVATGSQLTAIAVAMDMSEGIVTRFRTMSISRSAVMAGHVLSALVQSVLAYALLFGAAFVMGFRPAAGPLQWAQLAGLLAAITLAIIWLSAALGLVTKSVETASNLPMPLMLLPFFGSGFVPTDTMPAGLRWFGTYQPFTPMMEAVRHLLAGKAAGADMMVSLVWCAVIGTGGYLWSRWLYERRAV